MLMGVRNELAERIAHVQHDLKAEIHGLKGEMQELRGEMQVLRGEMQAFKHEVRSELHAMKAVVERIGVLVEEQNVRNGVVLEALRAMIDRQDRLEARQDQTDETLRQLASSRRGR